MSRVVTSTTVEIKGLAMTAGSRWIFSASRGRTQPTVLAHRTVRTMVTQMTAATQAGTSELVAMAWSATVDPDMYQIYHSEGGSNETSYWIKDAELDELIMLARQSTDQTYRKTLYKECLDIVADWAVEIPVYQRQNCIIFSTERVNMDTVTPDITTFWGWANDIELLEMN